MYVLDTNTLIYYFKGAGDVAANLLQQEPQTIAIPSVVVYELAVGIAKSNDPARREAKIATLYETVNIWAFGEREAQQAAAIRVELERAGTPIGPYDVLIAATALARGATLVTHNTREFGRVPGLKLQDWY